MLQSLRTGSMPSHEMEALLESLCLTAYVVACVVAPHLRSCARLRRFALLPAIIAIALIATQGNSLLRITARGTVCAVLIAIACLFLSFVCANMSLVRGARLFVEALDIRALHSAPPFLCILPAVASAAVEEAIWRGGVQFRLGGGAGNILLTALLFYLAHLPRSRKVRIPKLLDLIAFSIVCSASFLLFASLWVPLIVHVMRNSILYLTRYNQETRFREASDNLAGRLQATRSHLAGAARTLLQRISCSVAPILKTHLL